MTHSLIFFGSDRYSAIVLDRLIASGQWPMITIITDQKSEPSPVEKLAHKHNLKVLYYPDIPHSLITKDTLGLCASFDHLIPEEIIEKFAGRLYNLHPSLLPQYRNVSPVQYAIALGDQVTGITLFRIASGIDNGEIISQISEPILPDDTTPTLTTRLFTLGAKLLQSYDLCKAPANLATLNYKDRNFVKPLIFTRRLTRDSGYLEWSVLQKLLTNQSISPSETKNELLKLRLQKIKSSGLEFGAWNLVISDLCRSLYPWPGVWSVVPTRKGNLRISLVPAPYSIPHTPYSILISGKPAPITLADFTRYYLS